MRPDNFFPPRPESKLAIYDKGWARVSPGTVACVLPTFLELGLRSQAIVCGIRPQEYARSIETLREATSGHSDHDCVLSRLALVTSARCG